MIQIDLITGLLGSGKTTFMKHYAKALIKQGKKVAIIVNDYGVINVDRLFLEELENVDVEMIVGDNDPSTYLRRLKGQLINLKLRGYDTLLFEPSGIFDVDDLLDVLNESPINNMVELNTIITIVDGSRKIEEPLKSVFASELASTGMIYFTKTEKENHLDEIIPQIKSIYEEYVDSDSQRLVFIDKPYTQLNKEDYIQFHHQGYVLKSLKKRDYSHHFESIFFMDQKLTLKQFEKLETYLFSHENIYRIKGTIFDETWIQINDTKQEKERRQIENGQDVIIVIGYALNKKEIEEYLLKEGKQ